MSETGRIVVWVWLSALTLLVVVGLVVVAGELRALDAALSGQGTGTGIIHGGDGAEPTPWWGGGEEDIAPPSSGREPPQVAVAGVEAITNTVSMTVAIRSSSGVGYLLYESPVLVDENGARYQATSESLEEARYAVLDLVTAGQAQARLVFTPALPPGVGANLIFNPNQPPADTMNPRVEVPVPALTAPPTPTPELTPEG